MRAVLFEGTPEEFARVEAMFRTGGDPTLQARSIVLPQSRPKAWPETGEEHGYQLADIVLVALPSASVVSEQVRREVEIAQEQHAPIVPVMIEPVAALGGLRWHLIGLQRVDLTTNFDAGMTRLLQELGSIARRAGIDPDANDPEPKQRNGDPVSHTSKVFRHTTSRGARRCW